MLEALKAVLGAVVVLCALGMAGNSSYEIALEKWTEEKLARAGRLNHMERARIWSARCERKGMDTLAKRADTKAWEVRCVRRRVLTVQAVLPVEPAR